MYILRCDLEVALIARRADHHFAPLHVSGEDGAEQDDGDDGDARQILGPSQPVGEAVAGFAPGQLEGDLERHRRDGIADVVDGVGQQGDAARGEHHDQLQRRRDRQNDERPLDRPDAPRRLGTRPTPLDAPARSSPTASSSPPT